MPRLAVIIPCWNKFFYTHKTVESLLRATGEPDYTLILVDDGSTDETSVYAQDLQYRLGDSQFHYVQHKENLGVTAAWNSGLRAAMEIGVQYVAIVNNDVLFGFGWDSALIRALEADTALGVVSPLSTHGKVPIDFPSGSGASYNPAGYMGYMPILGACFMSRLALFEKIGLFPVEMKVYFGDNWLAMSTQQAGYRCGYAKDSYIHHLFCQTTSDLDNRTLWRDDGAAFNKLMEGKPPLRPYLLRTGERTEDLPPTGVR